MEIAPGKYLQLTEQESHKLSVTEIDTGAFVILKFPRDAFGLDIQYIFRLGEQFSDIIDNGRLKDLKNFLDTNDIEYDYFDSKLTINSKK